MVDEVFSEEEIEKEIERIDDFSEKAKNLYVEISEDIRKEIASKLDGILKRDIPKFNSDVAKALSTPAMNILSPHINKAASSIFGNNQLGAFAGNAVNNLAGNFLQSRISDFINANKTSRSSRETQRSLDAASQMRFSREQQATALLRELERAKRNL